MSKETFLSRKLLVSLAITAALGCGAGCARLSDNRAQVQPVREHSAPLVYVHNPIPSPVVERPVYVEPYIVRRQYYDNYYRHDRYVYRNVYRDSYYRCR